jgi:hypothetical protein
MKTFYNSLLIVVLISAFVVAILVKPPAEKITITEIDTLLVSNTIDTHIPIKVVLYQPDTAQCDSTPFWTADGSEITELSYYAWCAVSRDLMFNHVNFGDTIVIKTDVADGLEMKLVVRDNMAERWYNRIDIVVPPGDLAPAIDRTLPFIAEDAIVTIIKIIKHDTRNTR